MLQERENQINLTEYVAQAEIDDVILEILLAIANEEKFDQQFNDEKDIMFHNDLVKERENSSEKYPTKILMTYYTQLSKQAGKNILPHSISHLIHYHQNWKITNIYSLHPILGQDILLEIIQWRSQAPIKTEHMHKT